MCHGIPSNKTLKEGDIINVDVTAIKDDWHGDTSRMFEVGEVSIKSKKLINTTYEAMMKSISILRDGVHLGDIGSAIQNHVEAEGFQWFKIFVDMVLEGYFINYQIFYTLEKRYWR